MPLPDRLRLGDHTVTEPKDVRCHNKQKDKQVCACLVREVPFPGVISSSEHVKGGFVGTSKSYAGSRIQVSLAVATLVMRVGPVSGFTRTGIAVVV